MRISDCSSDVCSSDLQALPFRSCRQTPSHADHLSEFRRRKALAEFIDLRRLPVRQAPLPRQSRFDNRVEIVMEGRPAEKAAGEGGIGDDACRVSGPSFVVADLALRSEEHTSELQSLMRI